MYRSVAHWTLPLLLTLLMDLTGPSLVRGQEAMPPDAPRGPGAELTVYLMTMGPGDLVWEKFGHNAIWIHDPVRGTDWTYNYGLFDFASPGYWGRFIKGDWIYELGVSEAYATIEHYRQMNRSVTTQELNLTPSQKAELQQFLEWNALPQNREYLYDYYRDNCSTRIRDVLDRVLGGRLRAATADSITGTTYRWHSERLIAEDEPAYTGLAAGLGPAADRPVSAWEEMFLPGKVREYVRTIRVPGETGRMVPLVTAEQVLFEADRPPMREAPPNWIAWYLAGGVALGVLLVLLAARIRHSRAARFGFAALGALWSLLMGTGGLILLGLWTLTNHEIAYRNENLLQFNPLAIALVLLVPALAYGMHWAARPARWGAGAVAAISVLGLLLQVLPGFDQVNGEMIALILPVHLGLFWAVWRLAGEEGRAATAVQPPATRYPLSAAPS